CSPPFSSTTTCCAERTSLDERTKASRARRRRGVAAGGAYRLRAEFMPPAWATDVPTARADGLASRSAMRAKDLHRRRRAMRNRIVAFGQQGASPLCHTHKVGTAHPERLALLAALTYLRGCLLFRRRVSLAEHLDEPLTPRDEGSAHTPCAVRGGSVAFAKEDCAHPETSVRTSSQITSTRAARPLFAA